MDPVPPSHPARAARHPAPASPDTEAAALATADIRKLVATCDLGLTGQRDRAMILLGCAGALRRSELVGIEREHLTYTTDGLRLHLPRSKNDQTGEGAEIGIPRGTNKDTCPVRHWSDGSIAETTAYPRRPSELARPEGCL